MCIEETLIELASGPFTSEESDTPPETEGRQSADSSPLRQRRGGILKGGRLWKSSMDMDINDQNDDQRSATASDEDASSTQRSVRFVERSRVDTGEARDAMVTAKVEPEPMQRIETEVTANPHKEFNSTSHNTHRLESPLLLSNQASKVNSAVQQLFNSGRPPPPAIEPQLITSETLRAWDNGGRPKNEEAAVRRVAERNALRCSLLRSEARKKQQPKPQETTSLADRIRMLTCDVDDDVDEDRTQAPNTAPDKSTNNEKPTDKSGDKLCHLDKGSEKAFGSNSSSSSSSTLSTAVPTRQQPPDLGDVHQEPVKPKPEPRRQFLSTLAPLTACVGSTAHHEGFYYSAPGDRNSASSATSVELQEHSDAPAPDVVAGTPGAGEGEDGLAAFARATAPRTERLRQKYGQESQPVSSDDEHDDYGFHRRPAVRGIAVKAGLGASDDILQQMQSEMQPSPSPAPAAAAPAHACHRATYTWSYYSDASLNSSRPQSRTSAASTWSKSSEYVSRACNSTPVQHEPCYTHVPVVPNVPPYTHYARQEAYTRNCATLYANVGCSDSSQEMYSSQTSSEQTSPVLAGARHRRPESPPPIRNHQRLLYVPYSAHYHYQHQHPPQYKQCQQSDYGRVAQYYPAQQQSNSGASTPQQAPAHPSRAQPHYAHALQIQTMCPVPARYRPVPAPQPGGGKQMICFSEKVAAPLYQPAPGSPSRSARGAPEGAPSAAPATTSPVVASPNPVYYAMNV